MTAERTLDAIGLLTGTDKSSAHHDFLRHYEGFLSQGRSPVKALLEIGVFNGSSLKMWQRFYPEAKITALDVDPRCLEFGGGNGQVLLCDQSDVEQLTNVAVNHGPFDVVVDDGSHIWSHQILTFETMFPYVAPGGAYILEDIDTSYGHHVPIYSRDSTTSAAQYISKIANYILASTAVDMNTEPDLRVRSFVKLIDSITFIRRSALIRRK